MAAVSTIIAGAGLAVAAGSAINSADSQRKALHAQQDAINSQANSTQGLEQSTTDLATQNAIASRNLENQLTPEVQQLRTAANTGLLNYVNAPQDAGIQRISDLINQNAGIPLNTPLLNSAISKAQSDLALGGKLSSDQQNAATRQGAATAGQVGGGLGLGRDLTARDLGLSSAQVEQQRLMNASQLGGQEMNLATNNQSNLLNSLTALRSIHDDRYNQLLSAAQYGNSIAPPLVGLDPTAAANLQIARTNAQGAATANAANVQGQQNQGYLNLAGQALGFAGNYFNTQNAPYTSTVTTGVGSVPQAPTSPYGMNISYVPPSGSGTCWVAREVYGAENPEWLEFRHVLVTRLNKSFLHFYENNGEEIASIIRHQPKVKELIRGLMNEIKAA